MSFLQASVLARGDTEKTHQQVRSDPREVRNNAGGYVFDIGDWNRLDRFLLLGSASGTFYVTEAALTEDNIKMVERCIAEDGVRVVERVVDISVAGRALKQDYGLLALALACQGPMQPIPQEVVLEPRGDTFARIVKPYTLEQVAENEKRAERRVRTEATRHAAYLAIPKVCRTLSTLYQFVSYLKRRRNEHGPAGRGLKRAIAAWFNDRPVDQVAYQMVKYGQRYDYQHGHLLRLGHVNPTAGAAAEAFSADRDTVFDAEKAIQARTALYQWAVGKPHDIGALPLIVSVAEVAKRSDDVEGVDARAKYAQRLPREALPTAWLSDPKVWEALLYGTNVSDNALDLDTAGAPGTTGHGMPLGALVRNLGNLSKCGLLVPKSDAERYVVGELTNQTRLHKARIHPIALYVALKIYGQGRSERGDGVWKPVNTVLDALNAAFVQAFPNVEPIGSQVVVGIDVSPSMTTKSVLGIPATRCSEVAAAMALVHVHTEPNLRTVAFAAREHGMMPQELNVASDVTLERLLHALPQGSGTNGADTLLWCVEQRVAPDVVILYTDNETWAGQMHVTQALTRLRNACGKPVKFVVAGTAATPYTIRDKADPFSLDVAGFDAGAPVAISAFGRGAF